MNHVGHETLPQLHTKPKVPDLALHLCSMTRDHSTVRADEDKSVVNPIID